MLLIDSMYVTDLSIDAASLINFYVHSVSQTDSSADSISLIDSSADSVSLIANIGYYLVGYFTWWIILNVYPINSLLTLITHISTNIRLNHVRSRAIDSVSIKWGRTWLI